MNRQQLDLIPDRLLIRDPGAATELVSWLSDHGWHMSLAELEDERTRRGIAASRDRVPPHRSGTRRERASA